MYTHDVRHRNFRKPLILSRGNWLVPVARFYPGCGPKVRRQLSIDLIDREQTFKMTFTENYMYLAKERRVNFRGYLYDTRQSKTADKAKTDGVVIVK
jgi:hypothetical protein